MEAAPAQHHLSPPTAQRLSGLTVPGLVPRLRL